VLTPLLSSLHISSPLDQVLDALGHAKRAIGVMSIGCSVTTMEDVFVAAGRRAETRARELAESKSAVGKEGSSSYATTTATTQSWTSWATATLAGGDAPMAVNAKPTPCSDLAREHMHRVFSTTNEAELDAVAAEVKRLSQVPDTFTEAELNRLRTAYSNKRKTLRVGRERIVGSQHAWGQFKALFRKRTNSTKRDTHQLIIQLLPPLIFTLLALTVFELAPGPRDLPGRSMANLASSYGDNTVYVDASTATSNITSVLAAQLKAQSASQDVRNITGYSNNVSQFVLDEASGSPYRTSTFNRRTPLVIADNNGAITAWFNGQG
jgi:hypothetical protein